jgi:DNA polymerase-3 subunit beta
MELKAPLEQIKTALEVSRFTALSGAPALAGVHVMVNGKAAQFTGYNGEQAARTTTAVTASGDGEAILPRPAVEYINALPSGSQLTIKFESDSVKISCGKLSATMRTDAASNFPKVPFPTSNGVSLPASALRKGLREVHNAAASASSSHQNLAGVLFEVVDGDLRLVTTDSYRLAVTSLGTSPLPAETRFTLPIKAVAELERALAKSDTVKVTVSEINACFETDSLKLSSHLIAAKFPAYGPIIPAPNAPSTITATSAEILEAIKRLKIVAPRESRSVRVSCTDGVVSISTKSTSGDMAVEPLTATTSGTVPDFGVNVDYLADAVAALGSDSVKVSIHDPMKAILMTRPGDEKTKQVMMPIRI